MFRVLVLCMLLPNVVQAATSEAKESPPAPETVPEAAVPTVTEETADGKKTARNFYHVLADLIADFEYDVKNGNVEGLKDLSLRNIATSENVPRSFQRHLELLVTEKILTHSRTRIIQCLPCRAKTAKLSGKEIVISSAETNPAEMSRLAKTAGIKTFLDVAFAYQPTGLILSMYTINAENGEIIWSRSYNSETSRAAAFRRGVDFSQLDEARHATEYKPKIQYRVITYYLFEKNVTEYTGVLGLGLRMMERYDNRKKEVGFEIDYLLDHSALSGAPATTAVNLYSGFNITLVFVHAWNLIGMVENYNIVRHSVFAAIGGSYTAGFLGGLVRGGYEWRLGKHWAVSGTLGYRPPATAFSSGSSVGSVTGFEFGIGISALF